MHESTFTSNVGSKLPPSVYAWKINDNFAGGVPDAFYRGLSLGAAPLWAEYKLLKSLPKRPNTRIVPKLSAQQLHWLSQAAAAGEQAIVIVGVERAANSDERWRSARGFIMWPNEWVSGITASEAEKRLLDYTGLASEIGRLVGEVN